MGPAPKLRPLSLAGWVVHFATAPARRPIAARSDATRITLTTPDGLRLSAWHFEPSTPRGTVVLAHGYREDRSQLASLGPTFRALGLRTLAFDFRAHGESEGQAITFGYQEATDVATALAFARIYGDPVLFIGFSMGAVAYLLAGQEADIAILDSPYDTFDRTVQARFRRYRIPDMFRTRVIQQGIERFAIPFATMHPIDAVAKLTRPTLFLFAKQDAWIDADTRAEFQARLPGCCTLRQIEGGHADHLTLEWVYAINGFFRNQLEALLSKGNAPSESTRSSLLKRPTRHPKKTKALCS